MDYSTDNSFRGDPLTAIRLDKPSPELFADIAEEAARRCQSFKEKNKSTQLRRFYDELVMWHDKINFLDNNEARKIKFDEAVPFIQMLRAKVAYARGRDLVDDNFKMLFDTVVRQITTPETLRTGKLFLEAFLGYMRYLEEMKKNSR